MEHKHVIYDSILNKITNEDRLFTGDYTLDPYQNCEFGCKYCDSANDEIIYVKANATQILKRELGQVGTRTIIVGSVHDPYQEVEKRLKLTRSLLDIIRRNNTSCHILTKSDLILRDLDILSEMKDCIVTISTIALDKSISDIFEKRVPTPMERLSVIEKLSDSGIKTGLAIIPILPYIVEDDLENIIRAAYMYKARPASLKLFAQVILSILLWLNPKITIWLTIPQE